MVFSSLIFIFLFLPFTIVIYFAIKKEFFRNIFLLIVSLFFYLWGEKEYLFVMILSIVLNYLGALLIHKFKYKKQLLILVIISNLSLLIFFKYTNFLIKNFYTLIGYDALALTNMNLPNIHLPIGISFFTFQAMSYVIDVYRKVVPVNKNFVHVALYVSLFPQLVSGPIVRYKDVAAELLHRKHTLNKFSAGIKYFILGFAKKILIANTLGVYVDTVFNLPADQLSTLLAWTGAICYSLQIYFDFSGYSDMAIGLGKMFGFKFMENFHYPYISSSIQEFWRRWHISLSTWFRDYLYIPLGGNRFGKIRTYINLLTVFFLCGLWHGAEWTFIIWGLYHGLFLILERSKYYMLFSQWVWSPLKHIYTLFVIIIGWVFFRSDSLQSSITFLKAMFGFTSVDQSVQLEMCFTNDIITAMILGLIFSMPIHIFISKLSKLERNDKKYLHLIKQISIVFYPIVFILSIIFLTAGYYNPFIYFRF